MVQAKVTSEPLTLPLRSVTAGTAAASGSMGLAEADGLPVSLGVVAALFRFTRTTTVTTTPTSTISSDVTTATRGSRFLADGSGSGSGSSESKERVIPITVTLTDASATTNFQEVSVTVDLPSEKRTGVLSVPVGALLALSADQYGVEIVEAGGTTRKVPVTIGLFAGGRVEVSGEGVSEGQRVVVPQT